MKIIGIITLLVTLSLSSPAFADTADDQLEQQILNLTSLLRDADAVEYKPMRITRHFSAGTAEGSVVVFTIGNFGGGPNYVQYVAVFCDFHKGENQGTHYLSLVDYSMVGGKAWQLIKSIDAEYDKKRARLNLILQFMESKLWDGANKFSRPGTLVYRVKPDVGERLQRVSRKINRHLKVKPLYFEE